MVTIQKIYDNYSNLFIMKDEDGERKDRKRPNPYLLVKSILEEIEKLIVEKNDSQQNTVEKHYHLGSYLLKENYKKRFFSLVGTIVRIYWDWIDSHKLPFLIHKFIRFCDKAYPNCKISFLYIYNVYKYIERRIPRSYALIVNPERTKVFAIKNSAPNNMEVAWALPGGKVDFGETHEEAVQREVREELGIHIPINEFCEFKQFHNFNRDNRIYLLTVEEEVLKECKPSNPYEIQDLKWIPVPLSLPIKGKEGESKEGKEEEKFVCVALHSMKIFKLDSTCRCDLCK